MVEIFNTADKIRKMSSFDITNWWKFDNQDSSSSAKVKKLSTCLVFSKQPSVILWISATNTWSTSVDKQSWNVSQETNRVNTFFHSWNSCERQAKWICFERKCFAAACTKHSQSTVPVLIPCKTGEHSSRDTNLHEAVEFAHDCFSEEETADLQHGSDDGSLGFFAHVHERCSHCQGFWQTDRSCD